MKMQNTIEEILGSKIKIGILRLLYRTRSMYSGREISRLVGFSPSHTIASLRELEMSGLVLRQRVGRTDLYQLNEKNSAVNGVLKPVYDWESGLLGELATMYAERLGNNVVSIRLFGSVARDNQEPGSDIDLVLTVADGVDMQEIEEAITAIDLDAGQKFGCPVSTIVVTEKEYAKKVKSKQGFWKAIPKESKLLFGRER